MSNFDDPETRALRDRQAASFHSQAIETLNSWKTNVQKLLPDDKVWLQDWLPNLLGEVEAQGGKWNKGYAENTSDGGTRAVYSFALALTAAQRTMIIAVQDAVKGV